MKSRLGFLLALSLLLSLRTVPALGANSVRSSDIVDGQVMTVDLANNAVTSAKIQDGQVLNADLGASAITTDKILDGAVGTNDLASSAVISAKIANGAVTDNKITGPISAAKVPHDHDTTYQKKYAGIVVVAKSGGDFTDPIAAINSINDASAANPYLIKIMPGVYEVGSGQSIQMKEYVNIEGSGRETTLIRSLSDALPLGVIVGAANASLRNLSVEAAGLGIPAPIWNPSLVENVSVSGPSTQACVRIINCTWDVVLRDMNLTTAYIGILSWDTVDPASITIENMNISTSGVGIELYYGNPSGFVGKASVRNVKIANASENGMYIVGTDIYVQDVMIQSTGGGLKVGGVGFDSHHIVAVKNMDISSSSGYGIQAFTGYAGSKLEISDSRVITKADGIPGILFDSPSGSGGGSVILNNVYVNVADVGTAPALLLPGSIILQSFNSRFIGDTIIGSPSATLRAANSQITGTLPTQGTLELVNCYDSSFTPIQNQ